MADPTPESDADSKPAAPTASAAPVSAVDAAQSVVNPQITDSLVVVEAADEAAPLTGAALGEIKAQAASASAISTTSSPSPARWRSPMRRPICATPS